jgi:hypothetical protein
MSKFAGVLSYFLIVVSAEAADRWPPNVCNVLANMETMESETYVNFPRERAIARSSLLILQSSFCGVDVTEKANADDAAIPAEARKSRRLKSCTTIDLGGGLSTTNCQ